MMYLFFDTETTGLPKHYNAPIKDVDNWPRLVQLAWILTDADGAMVESFDCIVKPDGWVISKEAAAIHGITQAKAEEFGVPMVCTMKASTNYCKLPNSHGYKSYKWPKLQELHEVLFLQQFKEAHNAAADIQATVRCFFELIRLKVIRV